MPRQFRPGLRDRIYWSRFVQGAVDVTVLLVAVGILLIVEPVRLVRRLFGSTEDEMGEPSMFREEVADAPDPRPSASGVALPPDVRPMPGDRLPSRGAAMRRGAVGSDTVGGV